MSNIQTLTFTDLTLFLSILSIAVIALFISRKLLKVSFPYFFMGLTGLILGLVIGGMAGSFLTRLPGDFGRILPLIIQIFIAVGMLDLFIAQTKPVAHYFERVWGSVLAEPDVANRFDIILDTSILIDGRIEELVNTGFIIGKLIVPQFVLLELQTIADVGDSRKRSRGRRGLDVMRQLQQNSRITIEITSDRLGEKEPVDQKLVRLAKRRGSRLMTLDANLARVAQIQSVVVINIHELATALRPLLLPGEQVVVKVVQKGKEKDQGVGYMPDGTMIVVEGGQDHIGSDIECEVTRIYQTTAGKMIFVAPVGQKTASANS